MMILTQVHLIVNLIVNQIMNQKMKQKMNLIMNVIMNLKINFLKIKTVFQYYGFNNLSLFLSYIIKTIIFMYSDWYILE